MRKLMNLPPFLDDDMELEPKEPRPHGTGGHPVLPPAFFRYSFEYPVLFSLFAMASLNQCEIHKGYSRKLAKAAHLQELHHRNYSLCRSSTKRL
ncbi:hypothetical protein MWU78_20795 [Arenibacter sp. F26102]|uniref:hypothetical protein n=1 Tax=Arenibacter sp. F26102 TaxID=2926416 RepID=UPI001FF2A6D8|nr:hypothetical protein [Arenibacter sp. F26102]MCK0148097.1 hypothetical protein [Arenibacter sp. F26102]